MTRICKQLTVLLGLFSVVGLAQCGGTSYSAHTTLKILSQNAVVINAPIQIETNPGDPAGGIAPTFTTVAANWFLFNFEVDNSSTETLTLVNLDLTLSGYGSAGDYESSTATLNTSVACVAPAVPPTGITFERPYVAIIPPGAVYTHLAPDTQYDSSGCCIETASGTSCPAAGGMPYESWYIDSLPSDVTNWEVQVSGEGWFTDSSGEANERLVLGNYFNTQ